MTTEPPAKQTDSAAPWWGVADLVGGLLLIVMVVLVVLSIAGRSVPALGIPYADQMLPDLLVWLSMLGTAAALRRQEHLGISLLLTRLRPRLRRVVVLAIIAGAAVFFGVLGWRGVLLVESGIAQGMSSPAGYPSWLISLALPVGAGIALVYLARQAYREVRGQAGRTRAAPTEAGSTP